MLPKSEKTFGREIEVYVEMEKWCEKRKRFLKEGVSKHQILRETGMHWRTLNKILEHSQPPGYRQKEPRPKPKIDPYLTRIHEVL